ncbi:hypothetical protein LZ32DRAFT_617629 [Colletotrichum eremochloae]|nr:hypothetical protein LZ32DRAFT_617629 [Colletotrichum eremochloae]
MISPALPPPSISQLSRFSSSLVAGSSTRFFTNGTLPAPRRRERGLRRSGTSAATPVPPPDPMFRLGLLPIPHRLIVPICLGTNPATGTTRSMRPPPLGTAALRRITAITQDPGGTSQCRVFPLGVDIRVGEGLEHADGSSTGPTSSLPLSLSIQCVVVPVARRAAGLIPPLPLSLPCGGRPANGWTCSAYDRRDPDDHTRMSGGEGEGEEFGYALFKTNSGARLACHLAWSMQKQLSGDLMADFASLTQCGSTAAPQGASDGEVASAETAGPPPTSDLVTALGYPLKIVGE